VRAHSIAVSLDGFMAGPDQDEGHPMGVGGPALHEWVFGTATGRAMIGQTGGSTGVDDEFLRVGFDGVGASVMGRNMFGPVRGPWGASEWNGWWGDEPPYHHPVFVVTHHARPSLAMAGGTTFHFVTDGVESAIAQALDAAGGADVRLGGGASVLQQAAAARLIDELHVAVVPVLLGAGERLFDRAGGWPAGYRCVETVATEAVVHHRLVRVS
jgi:dihydrofolate reductase